MSNIEKPADVPPDAEPTSASASGDESAYPGDPATHRLDGPEDPAGVQQQTEDVDEAEEA
jgi:hypothetical protein